MSELSYLISKAKMGIITFLNAVIGTVRAYPYHDFVTFDDTDEPVFYQVGQNQLDVEGDQKKLFVSKSTMVISDAVCTIRFNHTGNAPITIRANTQYEFLSNISSVYVTAIGAGGYIDFGFEGVLPEEARDAL